MTTQRQQWESSLDPPVRMELQHSDHEHPLIFSRQIEVSGVCRGCKDTLYFIEPVYCCFPCEFFLHKSCAEFPQKIINMLHPAHHLHFKTNYGDDKTTCEICRKFIFLEGGDRYRCSLCDSNFHVQCALLNSFEPQSHEHSFIYVKPTSFTCDACGEEGEGISCMCTTCQIQIHKTCSDIHFPYTVKQKGHPHQLTLTYSCQRPHDFVSKPCKICYRQIKEELCFYHCDCEDCDYYAHLKCATSEGLKDDDGNDTVSSRRGENQMIVDEGKFKHFSHEHRLILVSNDDDQKCDEICFGCARPMMISTSPFYKCVDDQCNFLLHQQCAELSNEILHPLHVHLLTLAEKYPFDYFGMFQCCGCNVSCNGFTYMCSDCDDFFLCVGCTLFSDTLKHEGHPCTLSLISNGDKSECNACGVDCSTKFRCEKCNFNIDLRCASLPITTRGKCPNHDGDKCLFNLSFSPEDESGEYYCDTCEERRGKNDWFYYCEQCRLPFHPQCIVDKFMYIFGKTYQLGCHPHSLTFVRKAEAKGRPLNCASCADHPCKHMPILVCVKCDFYYHPWLPKDHLQHFSHEHGLIMDDERQDDEGKDLSRVLCDGCVRPLGSIFPYYRCVDRCNFYLHRECAALPNELLNPLHVHPLNLAIQNPMGYCGKFQCQGCDVTCNGFTYVCFQCSFFLDVGCALLSDTIVHEGHKCPLSLIPKCDETECSACGLDCSTKFRCETCNFDLDLLCASLPKLRFHFCHMHKQEYYPLKLTYSSLEAGSVLNFCGICFEDRSQNHWVYYCEDCGYFSHPRCLPVKGLIKFHKDIRLKCHPHSLFLVNDFPKDYPCETCGDSCVQLPALICHKCNICFHYSDNCTSIVV